MVDTYFRFIVKDANNKMTHSGIYRTGKSIEYTRGTATEIVDKALHEMAAKIPCDYMKLSNGWTIQSSLRVVPKTKI